MEFFNLSTPTGEGKWNNIDGKYLKTNVKNLFSSHDFWEQNSSGKLKFEFS